MFLCVFTDAVLAYLKCLQINYDDGEKLLPK